MHSDLKLTQKGKDKYMSQKQERIYIVLREFTAYLLGLQDCSVLLPCELRV